MLELTRIYYFVFAALTIAGGIMGLVAGKSQKSLVYGALAGVLLLIAGVWIQQKPQNALTGLIIGGVVSLALAGRFIPGFIEKHKFMPAGMMSILSVIGVIVTLLAFAKK